MHPNIRRIAFAGILATAACGGQGTSPHAAPTALTSASPSATGEYVFAAYQSDNGATASAPVVNEYGPTGAFPIGTLPQYSGMNGLPSEAVAFALDATGNIYVAYFERTVQEFAAAAPHALLRTISSFQYPVAITVDAAGNLFVGDAGTQNGNGVPSGYAVSEFAPGAVTASRVLTSVAPASLVTDSADNLYVGGSGDGTIHVFAPGATVESRIIYPPTSGDLENLSVPSLAIDSAGNLYVYETQYGTSGFLASVFSYPAGSSTPSRSISVGASTQAPGALALDSKGNIFVVTSSQPLTPETFGDVSEYGPGVTTPIRSIGPLVDPTATQVDSAGNVYILAGAYTKSYVAEYAPGATTAQRTLPAFSAFVLSPHQ